MRTTLLLTTILSLLNLFAPGVSAQDTGKIRGKLVDASNGEALIGANVILAGHTLGAATDIDGNFTIDPVPEGTYSLKASMIGYARKTVTGIVVKAGEITRLNIDLVSEAYEMEEVVVEANLLLNNEIGLLKDRQRATSISDAISSEDISRSGSGDAASAMTKVTGASVVDGKYIFIRGLGERYSATQLNGAEVPSADPNRRAVQLDIFPSSMLENIVTTKNFTPDKPGNFTGGNVNISTKSYPDRMYFTLSTSTSYNSQSTGSTEFLTYRGGSTDWLGIDDGTRAVPDVFDDADLVIPDIGAAYTDEEKALELDRLSNEFNSVMAPTRKTAPVNQGYAMSFGNQTDLFGRQLGYLASLTYSRKYSMYDDGRVARYYLAGHVDQSDELTNHYDLRDQKSTEEVLWGGLVNLSYKPADLHEFGVNIIYNRSADNTARYLAGSFPRDLTGNAVYETRTLHYTERELQTYQLRGKHNIPALGGLMAEWNASISSNTQDEPDLRFFTNNFTIRDFAEVPDTIYAIRQSIYPIPSRYFRTLQEDNTSFSLDMTLPFSQWSNLAASLKFGTAGSVKDRTFRERRFDIAQDRARYDGDPEAFFQPENVGILESQSTSEFYRFGNYVKDATQPSSNYDGAQDVYAAYAMVDVPVTKSLRVITGARMENTTIDVGSMDSSLARGTMDNLDILPAASLLYNVYEDMNIRASYGRTLARPTFRELAPYASFNFVNDFTFIGNSGLERTLIENYDLRWEWFTRAGEIVAFSGFYKDFANPIERVFLNINGEVQYQNVDNARVYGLEFEFRKRLDQISALLDNFSVGMNATWIVSRVDISESEMEIIRTINPYAEQTRELQGQSPYLLNINLSWQHPGLGTAVSLYFNSFGERLSAVSMGGTPNVYEQSREMLDLIISQRLFMGFALKLSAKNLLNDPVEHVHNYKDRKFYYQSYSAGREFSLGFSYTFE
ncbi:MAG: TonB-dependent receptor [Bacteroidetes bacterium]|nr:TonB-dependent receptor [Bacteroidota bacterium]